MTKQKHIRVLVVDDEPSIRSSLTGFFEDFGFEVCAAESGEQALEVVTDSDFEVAVVDLRLPGVSGDVFIIKAHKSRPSMRFLIHTGSVGYRLPSELLQTGLRQEHVFLKPVSDLSILADAVKQLVNEEEPNG